MFILFFYEQFSLNASEQSTGSSSTEWLPFIFRFPCVVGTPSLDRIRDSRVSSARTVSSLICSHLTSSTRAEIFILTFCIDSIWCECCATDRRWEVHTSHITITETTAVYTSFSRSHRPRSVGGGNVENNRTTRFSDQELSRPIRLLERLRPP